MLAAIHYATLMLLEIRVHDISATKQHTPIYVHTMNGAVDCLVGQDKQIW